MLLVDHEAPSLSSTGVTDTEQSLMSKKMHEVFPSELLPILMTMSGRSGHLDRRPRHAVDDGHTS